MVVLVAVLESVIILILKIAGSMSTLFGSAIVPTTIALTSHCHAYHTKDQNDIFGWVHLYGARPYGQGSHTTRGPGRFESGPQETCGSRPLELIQRTSDPKDWPQALVETYPKLYIWQFLISFSSKTLVRTGSSAKLLEAFQRISQKSF